MSVVGHPISGEEEFECIKREFLKEIGVELDASKLEYLFIFFKKLLRMMVNF